MPRLLRKGAPAGWTGLSAVICAACILGVSHLLQIIYLQSLPTSLFAFALCCWWSRFACVLCWSRTFLVLSFIGLHPDLQAHRRAGADAAARRRRRADAAARGGRRGCAGCRRDRATRGAARRAAGRAADPVAAHRLHRRANLLAGRSPAAGNVEAGVLVEPVSAARRRSRSASACATACASRRPRTAAASTCGRTAGGSPPHSASASPRCASGRRRGLQTLAAVGGDDVLHRLGQPARLH